MTKLQDFREQYPQYQDLDDEALGAALQRKYYQDLDDATFRQRIGLPPPPEPDKPPSFGQRVNQKLRAAKDAAFDVFTDDAGGDLEGFIDEPVDPDESPSAGGILGVSAGDITRFTRNIPGSEGVTADEPPAPPTVSLLDQFFAGWDEYRAARANIAGFGAIEDLQAVPGVARGQEGADPAGGALGVSGAQITKFARNQRAEAGDPAARRAIAEEITTRRAQLRDLLQGMIDKRDRLQQQASTVPFSEATQRMVEAPTWGEGAAAAMEDPLRVIAEISIRSAPNMADAIPLAMAGALTGPWGFAGGLGLGSGMAEYRHAFAEALETEGVDLSDADSMIEAADDPALMSRARTHAQKRAGAIGVFDTVTGRIASTMLTPWIRNAFGRELSNVGAQAIVQAAGGAGGETAAMLATGEDLAPGEILAEALGELGTAPIDVGTASVSGVRAQVLQSKQARMEAELNEMLGGDVETETPTGGMTEPEPGTPGPGESPDGTATPEEPQPAPAPEPEPEPAPAPEETPEPESPLDPIEPVDVELEGENYRVTVEGAYENGAQDVVVDLPDGQQIQLTLEPGETVDDAARLAREASAETQEIPPPPTEELENEPVPAPTNWKDVRLKRSTYRDAVATMADELTPNGGVTYIRDEHERIVGRTPSVNPDWFQSLNTDPDTRMSVRKVQKAVEKAIAGQKLGMREWRVVRTMLDAVTGEREQQVDYVRGELEHARALRENAARGFEEQPVEEWDEAVIRSGELFEEDEYDAEMSGASRAIYEMMEQANRLGVPEGDIERLAVRHEDNAGFMRALEELVHERRLEAGPEAVPEESVAGAAPAGPPGAGAGFRRRVYRGFGRDDPRSVYTQGGPATDLGPLLGPGRYYAFKRELAQEFGPEIEARELELRNPLVIDNDDAWRSLTRDAGWQFPNPFGRDPEQMRQDVARLREIVRERGHDGIVIEFDDTDPADVLPDGRVVKLLRQVFGVPQVFVPEAEAPAAGGDLFGDDVSRQQAIADEIRRRDAERQRGQESVETGDPGDLFSQARRQADIEDGGVLDMRVPPPERRRDTTRRRRVSRMSMDDLIEELYTDELTGIANRRAFAEEHADAPWLASIDADSLKWINDHLSPDAGDAMLIAIAEALDQTGLDAYHISGDEFYLAGETRAEVEAGIAFAKGILDNQTITSPRGNKTGVEFTYGIGQTKEAADSRVKVEKKRREGRGQRAARGEVPPGATLSVKANQTIDMEAGSNYVPIIGQQGSLPIDANNRLVLGNGRKVKIPKKPVRREHILALMQRKFGNRIYQGRVKGRMRLGFYRPGHGEIRIKNANDIEVAAHEVAHWLDDRYPWIERLYKQSRSLTEEVKSVSYDVEKVFEGYAEFMRLFFTQEWEAMSRAPGFYDAWTKALDQHPELRNVVFDLQELMHAWHQQGARARLASKHGSAEASIFEKMRRLLPQSFLQSALDGLRRVKQIELDIGEGDTLAYNKLRLALGGSNGVLEALMFYGTPGIRADGQGLEFTGDGLRQVFGDLWGDEDMALYMMARRAQELMGQGRENLMRADEIAAGLAIAEERPEVVEAFERYQELNSRVLDFAEQAGILGPETRELIEEANKSYVPFNRVIESEIDGGRVRRGGNPFQRLKGGTQNVNVVWDNIINNNGYLIRMALVNDGKRTLYQRIAGTAGSLRRNAGNQRAGLYAAPIGKDVHPVKIQSDQVVRKAVEAMGLTMKQYQMAKEGFVNNDEELVAVEMIDRMIAGLGAMVTFFKTGQDPTGNVDYYLDGGRSRFFEIGDPGLWDSIKFMGPKGSNLVLSVFGAFTATLRRGVVAVPVFQMKNFARDTINSWLLTDHVKVPAARALRVVFSRMSRDPAYQEMLLNGGGFANRAQGLQAQRKVIVDPTRMAAVYDRFMGRFENANRLAEYKAATAAGASPRRAALLSREISTDFAMRGSSQTARVLAISVPFLNARAQGNYRVGRQFNQRDRAISYAVRGSMLMLATLGLYALNRDDERYKELPEDVKDLYWVFFTGAGEDEYFLFPKPFESGMLWGTIPERLMQFTYERDGEELADALSWMALETFNMDMVPQVFAPWRDLQRNENFAGTPIIPFYLQNVEPSEQYSYYTSETVRAAAGALGLSPMKTEHVIRGYFGTLGTYALAASDAMVRNTVDLEYGEPPSRGETWRENWLVRALIDPLVMEGPPRRTKYVQDFYEMIREAEQVASTAALMQKRHSDELEGYLADPENQVQLATNPALQRIRADLNKLRENMDLVRQESELSRDEKRGLIWDLTRQRNTLVREAVTEIAAAQRAAEAQLEAQGQ